MRREHGRRLLLGLVLALVACSGNDKKKVNDPCLNNSDCADNICHAGICATSNPLTNGQSCSGAGECKSFRCIGGLCTPGANPTDAGCLYGEECASGSCVAGKCAAPTKTDGGAGDRGVGERRAADARPADGGAPLCPTSKPLKGSITQATTLDGCYLVEGAISVSAVLTIAPGSVLVFKKDASLTIASAGTLKAVGTSTQNIVFTAEQKTPGYWRGINIYDSSAPENAVQYAVIEYGGGYSFYNGQKANLALTSSSGTAVAAAVSNCVLRQSAGYGFYLSGRATVPSFAGNTVTLNALGAGYVVGDAASQLSKTTTYKGNTLDQVWVDATALTKTQTWPAIDVRYVVDGDLEVSQTPGITLTIEAGATLAFQVNSGISISGEGALTAKGTASAPITFTQASSVNKWRGLNFYNANSADNILDHVVVEHAGSYAFYNGQKANVAATSSSTNPVRLTVTNSTIRNSDGYGFYLSSRATVPSFAGNTVTLNALGAGYVVNNAAGQLSKTTTYKGNTVDMVWVAGGTLTKSQTWPAIDVRYVIDGQLSVNQTGGILLTIEAGATLAFRLDAGLEVGSEGALTAKGTAGAPITFTRAATSDGWRGVNFYKSNSADNIFDFVLIEGAGAYDYYNGDKANIAITSSSSFPSRLKLTNSTIRDSGGYGVWVYLAGQLTESSNTFSGNALGNIYTKP